MEGNIPPVSAPDPDPDRIEVSRLGSRQPKPERGPHPGAATGRSLKTGTETLRALQLLGMSREGLSPDELGIELGKSKATARYLLNTLCQEGFAYRDGTSGSYRLMDMPPWGCPWGGHGGGADEVASHLTDALTEVHRRTRQRSYLARVDGEDVVVLDIRAHQGLPRIPGLSESVPIEQAHALAVTKAMAALPGGYGDLVCNESSFPQLTHTTITDRNGFEDELGRVRQLGFALDREEFAEGFSCIAAPVFNPAGQVAASLAVSVPARRFEAECLSLIDGVIGIAAEATDQWPRSGGDAGGEPARLPPPRTPAQAMSGN